MEQSVRLADRTPPPPDALTRGVNRIVAGIARHWLAIFSAALFLYLAVPVSAPILMRAGARGPATVIYTVYQALCHELPERSYFLFGPQPVAVYSLDQLEAQGVLPGTGIFERRLYRGDPQHGYKIALCERDVAIYGTLLLVGLLYGLLRKRVRLPNLSLKGFLVFLIPIAVDGFSQLPGWRESNWELRTVTGVFFAVGCVWFAYPYVQQAMQDALASMPVSATADT